MAAKTLAVAFDAKFSTEAKQKNNLVSGFYWIQRTTDSGNVLDPELAQFEKAEPGRSFYLGRWTIFDLITPRYHNFDKIKVIKAIPVPV